MSILWALIGYIGTLWAVNTFWGFSCGKMWKIIEKHLFFRAAMAGLGKYCMGGYGRIGVYRVIFCYDGEQRFECCLLYKVVAIVASSFCCTFTVLYYEPIETYCKSTVKVLKLQHQIFHEFL